MAEFTPSQRTPSTAICVGGRPSRTSLAGKWEAWREKGGNAFSPLLAPRRGHAPQDGIHPQAILSPAYGRVLRPAVRLPGQCTNLDPPIFGDIDPLIVPKRVEIFR